MSEEMVTMVDNRNLRMIIYDITGGVTWEEIEHG